MSEVKYIIGKSASSLYEEIGGKRAKEIELLDYNTLDEIINYFCKIKNPAKIDFLPLLQYWQNQINLEDIQQKLKIGSIKEIHFDVTDNFTREIQTSANLPRILMLFAWEMISELPLRGSIKNLKISNSLKNMFIQQSKK